jgi:hypothetical protein
MAIVAYQLSSLALGFLLLDAAVVAGDYRRLPAVIVSFVIFVRDTPAIVARCRCFCFFAVGLSCNRSSLVSVLLLLRRWSLMAGNFSTGIPVPACNPLLQFSG